MILRTLRPIDSIEATHQIVPQLPLYSLKERGYGTFSMNVFEYNFCVEQSEILI